MKQPGSWLTTSLVQTLYDVIVSTHSPDLWLGSPSLQVVNNHYFKNCVSQFQVRRKKNPTNYLPSFEVNAKFAQLGEDFDLNNWTTMQYSSGGCEVSPWEQQRSENPYFLLLCRPAHRFDEASAEYQRQTSPYRVRNQLITDHWLQHI